jgi:N-acetylglucosaminyldiphosphoundecaprenol N-acetyl-beta-D-mannosaminyltransferase
MAEGREDIRLFGYPLSRVTEAELLESVRRSAASGERLIVASQNMHAMYLYPRSAAMRRVHERALVHIDGTAVLWLLQLFHRSRGFAERTAWIDFIWPLLRMCEREGLKVFWLAAAEEVIARGVATIREALPGLEIEYRDGFFDIDAASPENAAVVERINGFAPDVLIVGMGMPRQETWIDAVLDRLRVPVIMTSGACIEFVAGAMPTPPRWLGPLGLEWSYRFLSDPRRFFGRYFVEPWAVLGHCLGFALSRRRAVESRRN